MLGEHLRVGAPFMHGRGIFGDPELQKARGVPYYDRLDKRSGREFAITNRAGAGAFDASPRGISESGAEEPFVGLGKVCEGDDVGPYAVGWGVDFDRAAD